MSAGPSVTAFAPASVASLGPGLGVLGLALDGPGNTVTARLTPGSGVRVIKHASDDTGRPDGVCAAEAAASATLRQAGVESGIELEVAQDVPAEAGLGGAAASAVAAAYAVNLLIGSPLRKIELMNACLGAGDRGKGSDADNIAAALLGGMILIHARDPLDLIRLPVPEGLTAVVATPTLEAEGKRTRPDLASAVPSSELIANVAHASALVAACHSGDLALLGRALNRAAASSTRATSIRGCSEVFAAALDAGALGNSIVGDGPSVIAFCRSRHSAANVAAAMVAAFGRAGVDAAATISAADCPGARRL